MRACLATIAFVLFSTTAIAASMLQAAPSTAPPSIFFGDEATMTCGQFNRLTGRADKESALAVVDRKVRSSFGADDLFSSILMGACAPSRAFG
jgi:hypothetical protein